MRTDQSINSDHFTDKLLEEILVDAYGEDEQLWALRQVIDDEVPLPTEGSVIGETVEVTRIDYDGNPRHGLRATCGKGDGKTYEIALEDVEFSEESSAASYAKAYRQWLGVPQPATTRRAEFREDIKRTKVKVGEIDVDKPVDLIVLGVKQGESARCRLIGKDKELTLRSSGLWKVVPGEIVTVMPRKHWSFAGHPYLSGEITGSRFDLEALGLTPLRLHQFGLWDPAEHYWGEENEPEEDWEKEIKAAGPRSEYEMEKIVPGEDPEDFDSDAILEAVELMDAGDPIAADQLLNGLLIADLRCLDARAHLGNLAFDRCPKSALRHYDVGRQVGELSLGPDFNGVLPWGLIDNRPYLRGLHGYGLCLWRLHRFDEAAAVFTRMLWLNPSDNQGARFNLNAVNNGRPWEAEP